MSLNRTEQKLLDYIDVHPGERQYWTNKVRAAGLKTADSYAVVSGLERQLWDYYLERTAVDPILGSAAQKEGLERTSMRGLAELMLRLWATPLKRSQEGTVPKL